MVTKLCLSRAAGKLLLMPFFPTDPLAKAALLEELSQIAATDEQLEWMVHRALGLFTKWPGTTALRAVYCSRYKPLDGVEVYSDAHPEGIRSLSEASTEMKALPPGHIATADPRTEAAVKIALALQRVKDAAIAGPATPAEIAAAPGWLRRLEGYE